MSCLLCFALYLRAITKYNPPRAYIQRGDLTDGFLRYEFGGLIFGGAYTLRSLFSEFYDISPPRFGHLHHKLAKPVIQGYCMHFFNAGGKLKREL